MILEKQINFRTAPIEHHRTQGRLNSRVPVAIEWTKSEETFRTDGHTLDVSPGGCLAVVTQVFAVGSRLRLVNLANQNSCEAVVVWMRSEGRVNWQLGLELQEPGSDFWDLEL